MKMCITYLATPSFHSNVLSIRSPIDTSGVEETRAAAMEIMGLLTVEHLREGGVQLQEFDLV